VEVVRTNVVAYRGASALVAVLVGQRHMVQTMASYSAAVVGYPTVVVEPVRFVIVRVCWMGDWREDCLEQVAGHFEGDLFEIGVESRWSE
jgi:hypothetical protein